MDKRHIVRLTQIDGKLPNLALMKLAHWHRSMGDDVRFEKSVVRGVFEPEYDLVYGSAIFDFSEKKVALFKSEFPNAIVGGTWNRSNNLKVEDIIGVKEYQYEHYDYSIYPDFQHSIGFTQRGCRLKCSFCVVPQKEGKNVVVNKISDIWRPGTEKKIHLLDNDFFGQEQWRERSEEIIDGGFKVSFNQGINVRLIHKEGAEMLAKMKYMDDGFKSKRIYTAWDNKKEEKVFTRGINIMLDAGIKPQHIMVYMLCGYWEGETFDDIFFRYNRMKEIGLLPYPMVYLHTKADYKKLKKFQKWVIRRVDEIVDWQTFSTQTARQWYDDNESQLKIAI